MTILSGDFAPFLVFPATLLPYGFIFIAAGTVSISRKSLEGTETMRSNYSFHWLAVWGLVLIEVRDGQASSLVKAGMAFDCIFSSSMSPKNTCKHWPPQGRVAQNQIPCLLSSFSYLTPI